MDANLRDRGAPVLLLPKWLLTMPDEALRGEVVPFEALYSPRWADRFWTPAWLLTVPSFAGAPSREAAVKSASLPILLTSVPRWNAENCSGWALPTVDRGLLDARRSILSISLSSRWYALPAYITCLCPSTSVYRRTFPVPPPSAESSPPSVLDVWL